MNKYCTNCGNKLSENADICVKCGKFITKVPNNNRKTNVYEIFSIVGMALGIIGFLTILFIALFIGIGKEELLNEELIVKILTSIFFLTFPLAPSIPGLILSVIGSRKQKSIYGIIGLISSLLALLFIIASFIYLVW